MTDKPTPGNAAMGVVQPEREQRQNARSGPSYTATERFLDKREGQ